MNGLDFIFLLILGFTAFRGFARGLLKEFISVFGLIIGLALATLLYEPAAERLQPFIANPTYAAVIAYLAVFFLVLGGTVLLGLGLQSVFQSSMLSGLGRLGGVCLGLLKGGLVCSLLLLILVQLLSPKAEFLTESRLRPHLEEFSQSLMSIVPEGLKEEVEEKSEAVKKSWEDSMLEKLKEVE